jgi:hypothetical protein
VALLFNVIPPFHIKLEGSVSSGERRMKQQAVEIERLKVRGHLDRKAGRGVC